MRPALGICALVLTVLSALPAAAQDGLYQQGNRLYQEGDYAGAVQAYQGILTQGLESGILQYNLGNSYFKLGELGPAILHYERAGRQLPGDDDVAANLELARSLTVDVIEPLPRFWLFALWDGWVGFLPRTLLIVVVAGAYAIASLGGAGVILGGPKVRPWGLRAGLGGVALVLLFGTSLAVRELGLGQPTEAVIMVEEVDVRSAPSEDRALTVFSIHEGTKVRLDRRSDGWAEIVLEDARVGWVRSDVFDII